MSLFSKKSQGQLIMILDVQSSVVRGSLAMMSPAAVPSVVYTVSVPIAYKPHTDSGYLVKITLRAVSECVWSAMRFLQGPGRPENVPKHIGVVHFALSSPWIVSQGRSITFEYPKETLITKIGITNITESERAKLPSPVGDKVRVIEEKVFDVRLNGYSVASWEGKYAKHLDISYAVSISGSRMIERLIEACAHAVPARKVFFHSSLLLQNVGYGKIAPDNNFYALVDAHGELTDVAVIRHHSCVFFGSYPIGVRTVVRDIAKNANIDPQAAESLLTLYTGKHLDETHGKNDVESVESAGERWVFEFKKLLNDPSVPVMPSSLMISAWAHDDFFMNILSKAYPGIRTGLLSIDEMLPHVSFSPNTERRRLTALYAMALETMLY